jgi:excisionase family DNA binding protein
MTTEPKWIRPAEAATELGVTPGTMWKWIRCGVVKAYRTRNGRNYMLLRSEVARVYVEAKPRA